MCEEPGLLRQLELLHAAKLMRLALICQDMADGLMAVNDITGGGCYREGRGGGNGAQQQTEHGAGGARMRVCSVCGWLAASSGQRRQVQLMLWPRQCANRRRVSLSL